MRNFTDYIIEKLKVSKKSTDLLKIKLGNFITWYMFDNSFWDASDLQAVKFAIDTVDKYFNGSYNNLYDFINKHSKEVISVYEEKINNNRYMYSFEIDEIPFNLEAHIENDSELLSKQWRLLVEKLKVTKNPIKGDIKSTMKDEKITGTLEFTKTDFSESVTLPNTTIEIYNDKDELVYTGTTDENGKIVIEKIPYGKYYILEKEAPKGYTLNTEKMPFEIKEDGEIVKCSMKDEKIIEVPNTEKNEFPTAEVGSILLCLLGIGVFIYGKFRNKK